MGKRDTENTEEETVGVDISDATAEEKSIVREADLDSALDNALETHKEEKPEPKVEAKEPEATEEEAPKVEKEAAPKQRDPNLECPAEFTAEGKQAWAKGDISKVQAEFKRLNHARTAEVTRLQTEHSRMSKEYSGLKDLAKLVNPYIEASGQSGKDPTKAIMEAVAVVTEINKDPVKALQAIARLKGIKASIGDGTAPKAEQNEDVRALQSDVSTLRSKLEAQELKETAGYFRNVFESLQAEKNAAGAPKFPALSNDEAGIRLSGKIGSLVRNAEFRQAVQERIPGAGLREFVVEAYRWQGAQVDDSTAPLKSPQSNQEHIAKARRAAASQPGRPSRFSPSQKGKAKDIGSALDMAFGELADD